MLIGFLLGLATMMMFAADVAEHHDHPAVVSGPQHAPFQGQDDD